MNTALVWVLFVVGANGNLTVADTYPTEAKCQTVQQQKEARGWSYANCIQLSVDANR